MERERKIALVTGGSRGIGRDAAIALSRKGIDVILTYHTQKEKAESVVQEIENNGRKAAAFQLDTGDVSAFQDFTRQVANVLKEKWNQEKFDILINNAGIGLSVPLEETQEEQLDRLINVHFKGVFFLTQHMLPYIADNGRIVNISTGLTRVTFPGSGAYAAVKSAVEVLTKYMAKEWGNRGIRVNVVAPGAIATDFRGGAIRDNPDMRKYIGSQTALGRVGEPEDVGGVIASLCSEEMGWVNAQRIEVSGGLML